MATAPTSKNKARGWLSSAVILGLLIALAFNFLLVAGQPLSKVDPEALPSARTWVWWATREFLEQKQAPDVVLIGSSLLMHPVSLVDADYLNQDLDYIHHHRSVFCQETLAKALKQKELTCFNYALPGAMVSDDYILTRAMLTGTRKPKVIVLALGVRDFVESGISCAANTPSWRYFKRFCDTSDLVDLSMPHPWQRFDYVLGNWIYPWGKKLDLQVLLSEKTKSVLAPFFASHLPACQLSKVDPARNMPGNLRSEVEAGMFVVKAHQPYSFDDNSGEYKKRYRRLNKEMVHTQELFLERFFDLARAAAIEVVVVNMPLTRANHALMQPGSYDHYHTTLVAACARHGCRLVDLDGTPELSERDFYDTAHMNSSGGRKLLSAVCQAILAEPQAVASLQAGPPASTIQSQRTAQTGNPL